MYAYAWKKIEEKIGGIAEMDADKLIVKITKQCVR